MACRAWAGWGSEMKRWRAYILATIPVSMLLHAGCSEREERSPAEVVVEEQPRHHSEAPIQAPEVGPIDEGHSASPATETTGIQAGSEVLAVRLLVRAKKACNPDPGFTPNVEITRLDDFNVTVTVFSVIDSVTGKDFADQASKRSMLKEVLEADLRSAIGPRKLSVEFPGRN